MSDTLLRLYRALVRSKLDYGSFVYGSDRASYIKILDPIHNQGLRICLGAFRTSPMESLYVEANEESLYRRRERLSIQYALKLKSIPKHPAYKSIFQPKYSTKFADKPSAIPTFGIRINKLLQDIPIIELSDIADDQKPEPVWTINQPVIRLDLRVGIKREIHPTNFMSRFDNFHCTYDHCDFIYTDGSKTENAVGCAALMGSSSLKEHLPSASSIYTAELRVIVLAFKLITKSHKEHFVICTDSLSCLMAIGHLKQDHPLLHDIFEYYTYAQHQHKSVMFCWVPSDVGIQGNERVDALARLEPYTNIKIPYTDILSYVKLHLRKNWQFFWDQQVQSKLHIVHPELGLWPHSSQERRRDELILCRLRIGHTYLTHRHLLVGDPPPVCVSCQERLSVEHILIHCAEYIDIRVSCFTVNTVRELFDTVPPVLIISFIRRAGLLYLI